MSPPRLSAQDLEALEHVARRTAELGIPAVLVGAGARLFRLDWPFDIPATRTTRDWDFAVEVPDLATFDALRRAIADPQADAQPESVHVQVRGCTVDLIPFGAVAAPDQIVRWSAMELDVRGMQDARALATPLSVGGRFDLAIPPLPVLAALKCIAFEGRGLRDNRDLRDLRFIAESYERCGNEDRVFDEFGDLLAEGTIAFDAIGAALLGRDMVRACTPETMARAARVIDGILDDIPRLAFSLHGPTADEESEAWREDKLRATFVALRVGVSTP